MNVIVLNWHSAENNHTVLQKDWNPVAEIDDLVTIQKVELQPTDTTATPTLQVSGKVSCPC
jgi:hypothetical protein